LEERLAPSFAFAFDPAQGASIALWAGSALTGGVGFLAGSLCRTSDEERRHLARPRSYQLAIDGLEGRIVPATFRVNTTADISLTTPGVGVDTRNGQIQVFGMDTGTVTLRSAIVAANATPGGNTIKLAARGTYALTQGELAILPTGGNLLIDNTSGDGNLTVEQTSVGGGRVFDVNPGFDPANPTPKFTVTMHHFTITGGNVTDPNNPDGPNASGGGIRDQGNASLTLSFMTVTGNQATADGGGVAMENFPVSTPWTLTVSHSTISNNQAGDAGGGLETDGSGKVFVNDRSVISGNSSFNQGAGIWLDAIGNDSASLQVTETEVSNNVAGAMGQGDGTGGGIGTAGNGAVSIIQSTVKNNLGTFGGGFGGEDGQSTANLTVVNSTFLNNTSLGDGGGIAAVGGVTSITNAEIDGNNAIGDGGGLFANGITLNLQNATLANNVAANGGGIELQTTGTGLFAGSTITTTTLNGDKALNDGGGLDLPATFGGDMKLQNDTIDGNFAGNGGGLFWAGGGNVGMANTIVAANHAAVAPDASINQLFTATLNGVQQLPPAPGWPAKPPWNR
jgi:predicted outer membrane repeat protein